MLRRWCPSCSSLSLFLRWAILSLTFAGFVNSSVYFLIVFSMALRPASVDTISVSPIWKLKPLSPFLAIVVSLPFHLSSMLAMAKVFSSILPLTLSKLSASRFLLSISRCKSLNAPPKSFLIHSLNASRSPTIRSTRFSTLPMPSARVLSLKPGPFCRMGYMSLNAFLRASFACSLLLSSNPDLSISLSAPSNPRFTSISASNISLNNSGLALRSSCTCPYLPSTPITLATASLFIFIAISRKLSSVILPEAIAWAILIINLLLASSVCGPLSNIPFMSLTSTPRLFSSFSTIPAHFSFCCNAPTKSPAANHIAGVSSEVLVPVAIIIIAIC